MALMLVAVLTAPAAVPASDAAAGRPNVLLITIDTLRADRLSAYGYSRKTSPNLDRLITEGVRFTQARTVEPLTGPALCSMVTSRYPHQHGASRNGLRMRPELDSFPKQLREAGYRTAAFVGNWTMKSKATGLDEHFELYETVLRRKRWWGLVSSEATADDLNESAFTWLAGHAAGEPDRPFLLWVHYVEPHAPYRLQERHLPALGLAQRSDYPPSDRYDTEIAEVDRSVGELLAHLAALDLGRETLLVFTADHGESLGEHNYWGHGRHLYEGTLHIPLSVSWPGRLTPRTIDAPALNLDVAPTILGLVGLAAPASFAGYDWSRALRGEVEPPAGRQTHYQAHKGVVLSAHDSDVARRSGLLEVAIMDRQLKQIFRAKSGRLRRHDLTTDPGELLNLGDEGDPPSESLQGWMDQVARGLTNLDSDPPEPLDEESIESLRALGYTD